MCETCRSKVGTLRCQMVIPEGITVSVGRRRDTDSRIRLPAIRGLKNNAHELLKCGPGETAETAQPTLEIARNLIRSALREGFPPYECARQMLIFVAVIRSLRVRKIS